MTIDHISGSTRLSDLPTHFNLMADAINDGDLLDSDMEIDEVRYVHSTAADDTGDGLTWGTAKKTILAAYDALPATGGVVYIGGTNVGVGGEVANQGLWIAGFHDSAAQNLPLGWRGNKRCHFIGVSGQEDGSFANVQVGVSAGSGTDRTKPALWINGINKPLVFENLHFRFPAVGFKLGIDSTTGSRSTGNTSGMFFRNVTVDLNQVAGNGPTIDAGNFYWTYFENFSAGAVRSAYTLTAATIVSGTTARFTTSVAHAFEVGDTVDIRSVTPTAYNNSNTIPPWTITAVPSSTTFEADIGSSPSDGTVFGTARPVKHSRSSIIYAPELTTFTMRDSMMSGGGIYLGGPGPAPTAIELNNVLKEGNFGTWWDAPLYYVRDNLGSQANHMIISCAQADTLGEAAVQMPDTEDPTKLVVVNSYLSVKGAMTVLGGNVRMADGLPTRHRTVGLMKGKLYAQVDASRRNFHPTSARFVNLSNQDTSAWSGLTGDATVTTGVSAPDGSTRAATLSTELSGLRFKRLNTANLTIAEGDWLVFGMWIARATPIGPTLDEGSAFASFGSIHTDNDLSYGDNVIRLNHILGNVPGEGEWLWMWAADKFTSVGTPATTIRTDIFCTQNSPRSFYAPVSIRIPAGTLSDTEIYDFAQNMGSWPNTSPAGAVSTLHGQKLIAHGGLGVGNDAAGSSLGSVVKKVQIFDETGASLGYLPVYDAIT